MSYQVTTAFVQQYKAIIEMLIQQKTSKFESMVRVETQNSQYEFYDQIGPVSAQPWGPRHGDTPLMETPHLRRRVGIFPWVWADLIDKPDRIRMLIDPTSAYAQNAVMAFNRRKDDVIIASMLGTAMAGHNGEIPVEFPASQNTTLTTGLTLEALIQLRTAFWDDDVDQDMPICIACTPAQIAELLNIEQIQSADYNTVRALVNGDVDTFMGFKFVRSTRLPSVAVTPGDPNTTYTATAIAWIPDGVIMSKGEEVTVRVSERPDKKYSTQVFVSMDIGGVRMDEKKVRTIQTIDATKSRPAP